MRQIVVYSTRYDEYDHLEDCW